MNIVKLKPRERLAFSTRLSGVLLMLMGISLMISSIAYSNKFLAFISVTFFMFAPVLIYWSSLQQDLNTAIVVLNNLVTEESLNDALDRLSVHAQINFEKQQQMLTTDVSTTPFDEAVKFAKKEFWDLHKAIGELTDLELKPKLGDYGRKP